MKINLVLAVFCIISYASFPSKLVIEKYQQAKPEIFGIYPKRAFIGEKITIYGKNFLSQRLNSIVKIGEIECKEYDFDYVYWSNNIIKIKVPTGAKTDRIKLIIDNQEIIGPTLAIYNEDAFIYSNPMSVTIEYSLDVYPNNLKNKPLYIWVPSAATTDTQRNVSLLDCSKNYIVNGINGLDLFKIEFDNNRKQSVSKKFKYISYQLETKIDPDKVTDEYDFDSEFYKYYTSPLSGVESNDPRIKTLAKEIVKDEKNPYYKAKMIYDWIIDNFDYMKPPGNSVWRAIDCLDLKVGDCSVYSFLFCAFCHAVGIPARPVGGHVIFIDEEVSVHVWAEFFLPKYGWIPVDPNYGDIQVNGFLPREKYFGNLDNRHIAFSKGFLTIDLPNEFFSDTQEKKVTLSFLQKYYIYPAQEADNYVIYKRIRRIF